VDNINIDQNRSLMLEMDVAIPESYRIAGVGTHDDDDDDDRAARHLIDIVI
jgi:hypothetical protein